MAESHLLVGGGLGLKVLNISWLWEGEGKEATYNNNTKGPLYYITF